MPEFQFVVWMMLKIYSGFDLVRTMTSVSMTINGPAPMLLGFFYECCDWPTMWVLSK
jgi:methylmalonyl-CoA mutase N-terminal domain/subunit